MFFVFHPNNDRKKWIVLDEVGTLMLFLGNAPYHSPLWLLPGIITSFYASVELSEGNSSFFSPALSALIDSLGASPPFFNLFELTVCQRWTSEGVQLVGVQL